ncbi:hypothetical protein AKJ16_DCAP09002 [Drosera capensis]
MKSKILAWRILHRRCISSLLPKSNPSSQSHGSLLFSSSSSYETPLAPLSTSFLGRRLFSTKDSVDSANNLVPVKPHSSMDDVEDVSTEELKKRINKFFDGDEEALPSIFEGIMARKMAGKHDDSDDELMKELQSKTLDGNDEIEHGEAYKGGEDEEDDDEDYEFEDEVSEDEESGEDYEESLFENEDSEDEESDEGDEEYGISNEVYEDGEDDKIKFETSTRKFIE